MVTVPTPYFPCVSTGTDGDGILGRAFLQAAFFAADFQRNLTFLAQAPRPYREGSSNTTLVRASIPGSWRWGSNADVYPNDVTLKPDNNTNPIEEFEKTWFSENGMVLVAGKDDITVETTDARGNDTVTVAERLSTAKIVGISMCIVSGVVLLSLAGWVRHLYCKKRSTLWGKNETKPNRGKDENVAAVELGVEKDDILYELDGFSIVLDRDT